ncbi:MAG: thiamine-phosphate kinase [Rickettsiales bacterium]|nr:thiamine-phosphate kinase [Rickettsiales bacterium]
MANEFDLIATHFAPLANAYGTFDLTNDAAAIVPAPGRALIVTSDTLISGIHFFAEDDPSTLAHKALHVNLSDLAAMGAKPLSYSLCISLPSALEDAWIASFAEGLKEAQTHAGVYLLGGDTTSTPGPLSITVTAFGQARQGTALTRAGAQRGDVLVVSGTIGDAALYLRTKDEAFAARYHTPQARTVLGQALIGKASACLDISDGLLQDAQHIATHSDCHIHIKAAEVPLSHAAKERLQQDASLRECVLTGGDDYELLFTISEEMLAELREEVECQLTVIGSCETGSGVSCVDENGQLLEFTHKGWQHR